MVNLDPLWRRDASMTSLGEALDSSSGVKLRAEIPSSSPAVEQWPELSTANQIARSGHRDGAQPRGDGSDQAEADSAGLSLQKGPSKRTPATTYSLSEAIVQPRASAKGARHHQAAGTGAFSGKQLRKLKGFVKAYPDKDKLAQAIKKKVETSTPKNLSTLKRLILRERTAKAQQAAASAVEQAEVGLQKAVGARDSMRASLKEAGSTLEPADNKDPSKVTQIQVLEMALAEAERRVLTAEESLREAEVKAVKAEEDRNGALKLERSHRPKVLKSEVMKLQAIPQGVTPAELPKPVDGREQDVQGNGQDGRELPAATDPSGLHHAGSDDIEGLEGFENTLATWMYEESKRHLEPVADNPPKSRSPSMCSNPPERLLSSASVSAAEDDVSSEAESGSTNLDGWENVLEAWMMQTDLPPPKSGHDKSRRVVPRMAEPGGSARPSRPPSRDHDSQGSTPLRPMSVQPHLLHRHLASSPGPGMTGPPRGAQSTAHVIDLFHHMSHALSHQPRPLLADILAGGNVSTEAMLDLGARLPPTSITPQSAVEGDEASKYPAARTGGGGALPHPTFPGNAFTHLLRPPSSLPDDPTQLALLLKNLQPNGYNPGPSNAVPNLETLHAGLGSRILSDAELQAVLAAIQSSPQPNLDLFAQAADYNALADLGLPKLQGEAPNLFQERLSYNVLNAAQHKMMDNLSPSKTAWINDDAQPSQSSPKDTAALQEGRASGTKLEQQPRDRSGMNSQNGNNAHHPHHRPAPQPAWGHGQDMSPGQGFMYPPPHFFGQAMPHMPPAFHYPHPANSPFCGQNYGNVNVPWMHGSGMMGPMLPPQQGNMPFPQRPSSTSQGEYSPYSRHQESPLTNPTEASHDRFCEICKVVCCGDYNFQQHLSSKRHLRRAAQAGAQTLNAQAPGSQADEAQRLDSSGSTNPTYMGLKAQCRTYCKQVINADLNKVVADLLQQLLYWQERSKAMNPMKAKNKRLVAGLREVSKAVKLKKAKTIIVAPNIEQIESEGGLDDLLTDIMAQAQALEIPIVFALSRKKLGQVFGCRKKMSAIAILECGGAEELYQKMTALAAQGREEWIAHNSQEAGETKDAPGSESSAEAEEGGVDEAVEGVDETVEGVDKAMEGVDEAAEAVDETSKGV